MGKYDYDYNFSELLPLGKIASNVSENSTVLEFGCYTGGLAKYLKEEKNCKVYAIEIDEEAFSIAKKHLVDGLAGDIEEYHWLSYFEDIRFDVLIFADVLEHLRNPSEVLEKASALLKDNGTVLFSIPNIAHNDVIVKLLENRFDYTENGLLDSTHIHFWGGANLKDFFYSHGFFLAELDGHMVATEATEQAKRPARKFRDKNFKMLMKNRLYGEVYQFVGKLYKLNYARKKRLEFEDKMASAENTHGAMCKVYYNMGNGFNEDECLTFYRELENDTIDITAHVPDGTTEIRFDPIEGMECILYDVSFRSEYMVLDYEVENGRKEKECIVFLTTDPQIRIDFKGRNINSVTATARILCLNGMTSKYVRTLLDDYDVSCNEELVKRIQAEKELEQQINNMREQEKKLKSQYEEQLAVEKENILEMENRLEEMQKEENYKIEMLEKSLIETKSKWEHIESVAAEEKRRQGIVEVALKNANAQIEVMRELLRKTKEEKENLLKANSANQKELEAIKKDLDDARFDIEQADKNNEQLQLKLVTMEEFQTMTQMSLESSEQQRQQLINDYRGLEGLYFSVTDEYNRLLNSKSWRYTNAFRVMLSKIKKNRLVILAGKTISAFKAGGIRFVVKKIKTYFNAKKPANKIPMSSGFECSEVSFEVLISELEHLSAVTPITIYNKEKLREYSSNYVENNVLMVSHTLDLTGGPVAVRYFANKLLEDGYSVVVFSPNGGGLVDTLVEDGIPVVVFEGFLESEFVVKYTQLFSFAVFNTIVCAPLISRVSGLEIPVIWWIHEAKVSYHQGQLDIMPDAVGKNVKIYCGGEYAKKVLLSRFPNYQAESLLYYVPDYFDDVDNLKEYYLGDTSGKTVFASIGMQEERKGQDIFVKAILTLGKELIEKCYFVFIGKDYYEPIAAKIRYLCQKYPMNVKHITEVSPDELKSVYKQIDCLVCTSRDDPMPIVVTEAFLMKKMVICSENAGSAQFIQDGVNGFVYHNDDYVDLMQKIQDVISGRYNRNAIGEQARKIYESNFGKEAFNKAIDAVVTSLDTNNQSTFDVSVVIPTYNGGEQFKEMLDVIKKQKNCGSIEIVVVDSGSTDGTVEACQEHGVNLVQIPNEKFSHSYARNLGAESAHGRIIAFMTQDAMPSSDEWLSQMTRPIASGEVSAVSCGEQCPDGTDMYYRVASFGHARYVGFFEKDLVGSIENCFDDETLRKNASLNDVACIVDRKTFMRFKHRFNYAEDLDLGIRLLKKGYKIKLLSNVKVIHAHNRVAGYYLKRAIVENEAFFKIFPEKKAPKEDENLVASRILRSSYVMSEILAQIDNLGKKHVDSFQQFIKDATKIFDEVMRNSEKHYSLNKCEKFQCKELEDVVEFCQQNFHFYEHPSLINPIWGVKCYLENNIVSYVEYYGIKYTKRLKNDICGCLLKQFAFAIGAELSNLGESEKMQVKLKELTKGV